MIDYLSFEEAISYVKSLDVYGSVLGLENMRALAEQLGNPQDRLKFVHVTGTNGKGSVCTFLSSMLVEAGYKVGTYNSPAVLSNTDQFRVNGNIISDELYAESVSYVKRACENLAVGGIQPTRFEVETMVAFVAFDSIKCDVVILETGLGGRDDATNIIKNTLLHIIASISLDHSAVLGKTLEEIATIKSGIIKSSAPTVMYIRSEGAMSKEEREDYLRACDVITKRCTEYGSTLNKVSDEIIDNVLVKSSFLHMDIPKLKLYDLKLGMAGAYQPANAALAIYAARCLFDKGYVIDYKDIRKGVRKAFVPFRFERINYHNVEIVLDGAHNPDGAAKLMESLRLAYPNRKYIYITGVFADKDYEKIAEITAGEAARIYVITNRHNARSLDSEKLSDVMLKYNKNVINADNIEW